jgi:para-nitrobenzyl esterase
MYKALLVSLGFLVAMNANAQSKKGKNAGVIIDTKNGKIEGSLDSSGIRSFKGIPFAAPPVGKLRWKAPQPVKNWAGVKKTQRFGPRAVQPPIFGDMNFRSDGMSEDCLYLNVWAPADPGKKNLPVLVYFYGGGFVAGDGSEPRYDGDSIAHFDIVAVTVNYRLNVFGFLAHPELTSESANKASGNYGLLDQAAALKWVSENISAFGGDPQKITIAGESAGSVSVSAQMASPLSKKYFAGAIGESGSLLGTLSAIPMVRAEQTGVEYAKSIGAENLEELRSIDADSIVNSATRFGPFRFAMTVDGYFFPREPLAIYEAGEQARVPLLVGWNSEESNYRGLLGNSKPDKMNFEKKVRELYGKDAEEILRVYTAASDAEVEQVATELAGDRFIGYSTWKWADVHLKTSGQPVYRYLFERPRPDIRTEMGDVVPGLAGGVQKNTTGEKPPRAKGAVHSAEIEYAMGNLSSNHVYAWEEDDYKVSRLMQQYFVNFIKTGNPSGKGLPQWPPATSSEVPVMHINVESGAKPEANSDRYQLLDRLAR